ncbi:hypothetical protein HMPREF1408_01392 [Helicobacter pylori GAM245Ai]|nr:hypothetical protein HMPREF1408_01392 [Helicobacter pylori GAM245Ai]
MFLKLEFLNFFISLCYGYFWICYTKTFIFKNGLFLLCFVILKLILKFYCKTHFIRG